MRGVTAVDFRGSGRVAPLGRGRPAPGVLLRARPFSCHSPLAGESRKAVLGPFSVGGLVAGEPCCWLLPCMWRSS